MKNSKLVYLMALLACFFCMPAMSAVQYISSPPLSEVVKTTVGPVQESGSYELPIITWGGDIATIDANGNSQNTAQGSIFAQAGLNFKLVRQDVFTAQLDRYISGKSPYLRGTLGMINMASEVLSQDPRTKPIVIYQKTWSFGGDCLVVKEGIGSIKDLKGKTIVMQAYGPQIELLVTVLNDAGLTVKDVTIRWVKDLTGTENSPAEAFRNDPGVDACFVISPDAAALTSNGTVGTGAEQSVKGARTMFSTKAASKVISDVYAVRTDFFRAHQAEVAKFVHSLLIAQEGLEQMASAGASRKMDFDKVLTASAKILLDSEQAMEDARGLYNDCKFVGYVGNVKFFATPTEPRRFDALTTEFQGAFLSMGLISKRNGIEQAGFDYEAMKNGLTQVVAVETPRFQANEVAKVINEKAKKGGSDGAIFAFEILFEPQQRAFNADLYKPEFDKVIELAYTYGGAIITVEGHSDPTQYLDTKSSGAPEIVLSRLRQSGKNLSLTRAISVRESIIEYAKGQSLVLDPSQFAVVGFGLEKPKTGMINGEPVRPKTEEEWKSNRRVEFRLIPIGDTEASVFTPAGGGK